uniref:Uncharacterized protein n=1 Tax=Setaria viridis TaxID=4556 RepID=A0A4U6TFZ6_SETVI|nr:hypothetical protein SEVIR_8G078350v2 [Setaria viridis]
MDGRWFERSLRVRQPWTESIQGLIVCNGNRAHGNGIVGECVWQSQDADDFINYAGCILVDIEISVSLYLYFKCVWLYY